MITKSWTGTSSGKGGSDDVADIGSPVMNERKILYATLYTAEKTEQGRFNPGVWTRVTSMSIEYG